MYFSFLSVCVCMCNMPAQELCLYTLGNLWPDGAVVKEKLLVQGMVPALANCIQVNTAENLFSYPSRNLFHLSLFRKTIYCILS